MWCCKQVKAVCNTFPIFLKFAVFMEGGEIKKWLYKKTASHLNM